MTDLSNESESLDTGDERTVHAPGSGAASDQNPNRMHERPSPTGNSQSGLVSRDYRPRTGGPELIMSWPLGTAPQQTKPGDDDWVLESMAFTSLKRALVQLPYLGPIDYTKIYLNVRGAGRVDSEGEVLTLRLSSENLSGKPYEIELELTNNETEPFISPMVEFTPDARDYGEHEFIGKEMYGAISLEGKITDGAAYLDQGTAIQVWSE